MATQMVPVESLTETEPEPRATWLEERRKGIGGSDVHHLFPEESKYGCTLQLWYDKTGTPPDYRRAPAEIRIMERGNLLEDVVADIYMAETGRKVIRKKQPYVSEKYPFARVNIDRRIVAIDGRGPGVLEIKTYNPFTWSSIIGSASLPISVPLQVQHGMMVTGYKWGAYAPWEPAFNNFAPSDFDRDEALIEVMIERESEFWRKVIHRIKPDPLPDFNDKRCKTCQWRMSCRGEEATRLNDQLRDGIKVLDTDVPRDESPELAELLNDYKQADFYVETLEAIKDRVKEYMGDAQVIYSPDAQSVAEYKWQKGSSTWDTRALTADSATIGRQIAFAKWAEQNLVEAVAAFCKQSGKSPTLESLYKKQGMPSRRFSVSTE